MKSNVNKLDIDKLEIVPTDLTKLGSVVDYDIVKKTVFDELVEIDNIVDAVDVSRFVEKAEEKVEEKLKKLKRKIPTQDQYITTNDLNTFSGKLFDERLKQMNLAWKKYVNAISQQTTKNEEKIEKLNIIDLSYLFANFYCWWWFPKFVCQPTIV